MIREPVRSNESGIDKHLADAERRRAGLAAQCELTQARKKSAIDKWIVEQREAAAEQLRLIEGRV